jgi:hypothetical protein
VFYVMSGVMVAAALVGLAGLQRGRQELSDEQELSGQTASSGEAND